MDPSQLEKCRQQLQSRMPLLGSWIQGQALRTLAEDGSAEAMRLLAEAVTQSEDESIRSEALGALQQQAGQGNVAAQEALCRLVIHHDHLGARKVVFSAGYVPHDETHRALFYFLTEQWENYESLDFDHRLLRAAYDAADPRLRRLIAARARQAGRVEWVEVVAGGKQGRRLGVMTEAEWQAAISVLVRGRRWQDLWRLAQEAPPRWSAEILRRSKKAKWPVVEEERPGVNDLVRLAKKWDEKDLSGLMHHRATLQGHDHEIRCLAIAPSGKLLASGSADFTVRLWSLPDGQFLKSLERHLGWVNGLAITPNGRILASAGRDGRIYLWRLPDGEPLKKLNGHTQAILCLALSSDGHVLASGSADATVRLWGLPRGQALATLEGHEGSVSCLAISPDSQTLASGSADGSVRLWGLPNGRRLRTLEGHYGLDMDGVLSLAISPDGEVLASGGIDSNVLLWSLPDGGQLKKLRGHTGQVGNLLFHPDGKLLISGGGDHAVQLWRLPSGRLLKTLEGHVSENHALVQSPDGRMLVCSSGGGLGFDHTVRLWSLPDGRLVRMLSGHTRSVTALAVSPDSRLLASGSGDGTVRLWTSELARLSQLPVGKATLKELKWIQDVLAGGSLSDNERYPLEFIAALMRWRRRSDIMVDQAAPRMIEVGAFDIMIER